MEKLEQVARTVDEDEDGTTPGIFTETVDDLGVESIEGFSHVAGCDREEYTKAAGEGQHGRRRVVMSSAASDRNGVLPC